MIYIMDGKTFLKMYIKENPSKVLKTQFIIVSSNIKHTGKYKKQVLNCNGQLYPSQALIMDYEDYDHPEYVNGYYEQLEEYLPLLATFVKYDIDEGADIVFLCSAREKKYKYLKHLKKYMEDKFQYPVYDYKKLKDKKDPLMKCDEGYTNKVCDKILKKAKKEEVNKKLSSEKGKEKYFGDMKKEELKKELKKRDLYIKGLSKQEMIDILITFV